jgi:hypothetical protein
MGWKSHLKRINKKGIWVGFGNSQTRELGKLEIGI